MNTAFDGHTLAEWTGGAWTSPLFPPAAGFDCDTRKLRPGSAFIALRTEKRDGHDFVVEAAAHGASCALVSRHVVEAGLPQLVVADPLAAFQEIARRHRLACPATVVGVTGSAGKTSTKNLLALLLGGEPGVLATEGNLNNFLGVPLTLTRLGGGHQFAVVEAGINEPGEMDVLARMIVPDAAVVTLVAEAHLEGLGSIGGVAREKSRLPAAVRDGGVVAFPHECLAFPEFHRFAADCLVAVPEGQQGVPLPAGARAVAWSRRRDGDGFTLGVDLPRSGRRTFTIQALSDGMVRNAVLGLALADALGQPVEELAGRLARWRPARWRGEVRRIGESLVYIDCYNANPASMADSIGHFAHTVPESLPRLYIIGGMEELGACAAELHRRIGRMMRLRKGDAVVAMGDHAKALFDGVVEGGNDPSAVTLVKDVAAARAAFSGFSGAVLVKGSRRHRLETLVEAPAMAHATC